MLRRCLPQSVPDILSQLPATLDETYARILQEIGKTNELYALRLLQCLTVAIRPLFVDELAEILALDFGAEEVLPELREDWRSSDYQDTILSMCSSLVVVLTDHTHNRDYVQFSHFSVKEFLTSDRLLTPDISHLRILPEPAHTVVAKACLGLLLLPEDIGAHSPLISYAAYYWADHARFEELGTCFEDGMQRLLDPAKPHLKAWLGYYYSVEHDPFFLGYNHYQHSGSSLYYASLCGFRDLVAHFISENSQHVSGQVGRNPTPLVAALSRGHLDIAELLYEAGANLEPRNCFNMTLLHAASLDGRVDVANWLFEHGVSTNSQQDNHETPLHLAQVNLRMSVNAVEDNNRTPLHLASRAGHVDMVRELLLRGADVNALDRSHWTPLHLVCNAQASFNRTTLDRAQADIT